LDGNGTVGNTGTASPLAALQQQVGNSNMKNNSFVGSNQAVQQVMMPVVSSEMQGGPGSVHYSQKQMFTPQVGAQYLPNQVLSQMMPALQARAQMVLPPATILRPQEGRGDSPTHFPNPIQRPPNLLYQGGQQQQRTQHHVSTLTQQYQSVGASSKVVGAATQQVKPAQMYFNTHAQSGGTSANVESLLLPSPTGQINTSHGTEGATGNDAMKSASGEAINQGNNNGEIMKK
jgi:hypothetical protein